MQPTPADPATFKELTWDGEGGEAYAHIAASISTPPKSGTPESFSLDQNYPNPFNPTTNFGFRISDFSAKDGSAYGGGFVSLKVFDVLGKEVSTLVSQIMVPGSHVVTWNAGDLPSGIYVYQMRMGSSVETKKCTLLR
jgi:hypothetical protein